MKSFKRELIEWIITFAAAGAVYFVINIFGGMAVVEGPSMMPTLQDGDILIRANYMGSLPQYGDIVAFKTDAPHPWKLYRLLGVKKALVKRVIGLPGDHVVISNGEVYVNDKKLQEGYLNEWTTEGSLDQVVPEGHYFVLGDNRGNSNDSRGTVGFVGAEALIGKIKYRIFPFNSFGRVY